MVAEQPGHLRRRLEVAFGIGGQPPAGVVDAAMLADTGQHVLQRPAVGAVIEHVVGGHQRQAVPAGQGGQPGQPLAVVTAIQVLGGQIEAGGMALQGDLPKGVQMGRQGVPGRRSLALVRR